MPEATYDLRRLFRISFIIVGIWVIFAVFNSSEFYQRTVESGRDAVLIELLAYQLNSSLLWAVFTPFIVFVAERLPLRKPHLLRNALLMIAFVPFIAVVRAAIGAVINRLGDREPPNLQFTLYSIEVRYHRNIFLALVILGITYFIFAQRAAAERERNALALRTAVTNAELQGLRAAMQPRMMFATLDAIAEKVTTEPDLADQMIVHLGDLLRTMLEFGKRASVTLGEELEVIDRYFEIERARSGGAFTTRVDVEEEILAARVPPLLLHALVESALFGTDTDSPQRMEIHGRTEGSDLLLEVVNDDPKRIPAPDAIEETRARLQQAFGERATIAWRAGEKRAVTELSMPLQVEVPA
ncbi:MAG TPA: histidine kinase [Thermoanaerobaculia bacterium]|nr:histidine kinase [Thermoanaerobaculia bacterium]